jgi:predicted ferric reductase
MQLGRAIFWIAVYLGLVLAPLFVLLLGGPDVSEGFWWNLAIAFGFAGTAMMGVQFMLTARFKRAMAPFGIDIIYYFHRHIASVALALILAHPVMLIADSPELLGFLNPLHAPWHMTAGVASIVLLLALIVTSWWRKAMGLSYDAWRRWHGVLAVAALALALAHIGGAGRYAGTWWQQSLWAAIGFSCLGVIIYVRLLRPWWLLHHPYEVVEVRPERGDAWTVAVEPRGHGGFRHRPGQFAWLTLRGSPFAMREHPFSISSAPSDSGRLEFTIKELGDFTTTIGETRPGETAYVDGPYGAFIYERHAAPGYVFIAGGVGIAPLMGMLRALADRNDTRPILLIYAYRRWERMTFREEIEALKSRLKLTVVHVLDEPPVPWEGETGRIDAGLLNRHLPADRNVLHYFICGPEAMTQSVERLLHGLGIPLSHLHTELFDLA